eukprot:2786494-Prymnesium_polylepis.2
MCCCALCLSAGGCLDEVALVNVCGRTMRCDVHSCAARSCGVVSAVRRARARHGGVGEGGSRASALA